jgi:hypothetical protein
MTDHYAHRREAVGVGSRAWRVAGVVMSALLMLATAACRGEQSFPGALPGQDTDVSSAEAFHHYGIKAPPSTRNLRYSAMSTDDTYPLVAIFAVDCEEVPAFVSQSSVRQVSYSSVDTSDVEIFAERYGWGPPGTADSWYVRNFAKYETINVLVHQADGTCTVYLTA